MKLRLGTRGSDLARTQSLTVARRLEAAGHAVELVIIQTAGDRSSAPSFGAIGPQGVFVREIEQALAQGEVDFAVHSFKDLPTSSPPELLIAAVPERVDPADVLLVREGAFSADGWLPLAHGASVGTASARRRVWLHHFRPDLEIEPLRGNVPTRIRRLSESRFDAIVLAAAGLDRLRAASGEFSRLLEPFRRLRLDPERFVCAPAQGALAVQCRRSDAQIRAAIDTLDHAPSRVAVEAERAALARAEGGCDVAFGAYCRAAEDGYRLTGMLERAGRVYEAGVTAAAPDDLAERLFAELDVRMARARAG